MIKRDSDKKSAAEWGSSIVFYCKDCEKIVETHKVGRKYVYKCKNCGTKNVAFGTAKSIRSFFHIEEEGKKPKSAKNVEKSKKEAEKA